MAQSQRQISAGLQAPCRELRLAADTARRKTGPDGCCKTWVVAGCKVSAGQLELLEWKDATGHHRYRQGSTGCSESPTCSQSCARSTALLGIKAFGAHLEAFAAVGAKGSEESQLLEIK